MNIMLSLKKIFSDYMGVVSSILCLIHCLGLPFVFFLGQYFGFTYLNSFRDGIEHIIFFDIIFLLTASISVFFALKHAHSKEIKILLCVGWTFFAIGVIFESIEIFHYFIHLGSILLITGHIKNIKLCKTGYCEVEIINIDLTLKPNPDTNTKSHN